MTSLHVVVTGAGGFVGGHLSRGFAALGWRVTGVDLAFDAGWSTAARMTPVTADLSTGMPLGIAGADLVIHGAAITTEPDALGLSPESHVATNLRLLATALEWAVVTRPRAFVFLSSSGVFDARDGHECLTDADVPTSTSAYAVAKREGERRTLDSLGRTVAAHVVRLGHIYGPHEIARPSRSRVSLVAQWIADAGAGRPLLVRQDNPRRDWTWAPDLAPALGALIAGGPAGAVVHLCGPHVLHDRDLAELVAGHRSGATIETVAAGSPVKPPLRSTDRPALRQLSWTAPRQGIAWLCGAEVLA